MLIQVLGPVLFGNYGCRWLRVYSRDVVSDTMQPTSTYKLSASFIVFYGQHYHPSAAPDGK